MSEAPAPETQSASSRLFDIRLLIGGLFVVYGVILTITGFLTSSAEIARAAGLNINLWLGIGMLVVGALFLLWARLNREAAHADPNPTRRVEDGSEVTRDIRH